MPDAEEQTKLADKINEFLEYLEIEKGSSPLTIRNYKHYLNRFNNWIFINFQDIPIEEINQETIRKFRVFLSRIVDLKGKPISRKTQGYHVISLRSFLRYLIKNDFNVISPDKLDLPKIEGRQVKFLNGEQVDRLLNAPSLSTIQGKRDKAILEVFYSTGLRVSELAGLNRDMVDLERREFGVVGKGGHARVVFLSNRASEWLGKYLHERDDHYKPLFISHKKVLKVAFDDEELRLSVRSIQRMIKKYARKIHLTVEVTPHIIRHSFATDLLMAGADLRSVQEMLGHKNVQTTQIYTHVTHKHLRDIHTAFHGKGR